jgi:hypothetical protein
MEVGEKVTCGLVKRAQLTFPSETENNLNSQGLTTRDKNQK